MLSLATFRQMGRAILLFFMTAMSFGYRVSAAYVSISILRLIFVFLARFVMLAGSIILSSLFSSSILFCFVFIISYNSAPVRQQTLHYRFIN